MQAMPKYVKKRSKDKRDRSIERVKRMGRAQGELVPGGGGELGQEEKKK